MSDEKTQETTILGGLVKHRNRVAEEIGELLSMKDSIDCDIAEARERLQELNDDIKITKEEEAKEAKDNEVKFKEVLKSGDYSALAWEYRRLNKMINEYRKRHVQRISVEGLSQLSEGEVRQQRRDVVERLAVVEAREVQR